MTTQQNNLIRLAVTSMILEGATPAAQQLLYDGVKQHFDKHGYKETATRFWQEGYSSGPTDAQQLELSDKLVHFIKTGELT